MASTVPTIISLTQSNGQIQVFWNTVDDSNITQYVATVYNGNATVLTACSVPPNGSPFQSTPLFDIPGESLNPQTAYYVQVGTMWGASPGQDQLSQMVPLITELPVLIAAFYENKTLTMQWRPSAQAVQGYLLEAIPASGKAVQLPIYNAQAEWGQIQNIDLSSGSWSVLVSASGAIASNSGTAQYAGGAQISLPPSLTSPQGLSATLSADGDRYVISAVWTAMAANGNLAGYRLQIFAPDGTPGNWSAIAGLTAAQGELHLSIMPQPGSTLRLLAVDDNGVGIAAPAQPIITACPVLVGAAYGGDNESIAISWNAARDPAITGYAVQIFNRADPAVQYKQTVEGANVGTINFTNLPQGGLAAGISWAVQVEAVGAAGTIGNLSLPIDLATVAPSFTSALVQGDQLTVTWAMPPEAPVPAGYAATAHFLSGMTIGTNVQGGQSTQTSFPLLTLTGPPGISVITVATVNADGAIGPAPSLTPLLTAPEIRSLQTDPISGISTLTWQEVQFVAFYVLETNGAADQQCNTNSFTFAAPLPAGGATVIRVIGEAGTLSPYKCTPFSQPVALPTAQTKVNAVTLSLNKNNVVASWDALEGATGYVATLLATSDSGTVKTSSLTVSGSVAQATIALPLGFKPAPATQYSVVVQGVWDNCVGLPSPRKPVFTSGYYLSSGAGLPFIYPATQLTTAASVDTDKNGESIVLYLPDLGGGQDLQGLPLSVDPFTLAANADSTAFPYTLTIAASGANNPWQFHPGQGMRTDLAAAYQKFLKQAGGASIGVTPQGIGSLQQVIGRMLPQTFTESLFYNFGLTFPGQSSAQAFVDLRPGMVLRVMVNPWQTVTGGTAAASWLNGYAGSAGFDYDMGGFYTGTGGWSVGFDSFIDQLTSNGALQVAPPQYSTSGASIGTEQGIGEAADLYFAPQCRNFFRLYSPVTLSSTSSAASLLPGNNFALVGAGDYTSLCNSGVTPGGAAYSVAYFRSRAVVKACLRVSLNNRSQVVPVGATLGNLLEANGTPLDGLSTPVNSLTLIRGLGGAVMKPGQAQPASYQIRFDWDPAGAVPYGPGWGITALPLLPGDRIVVE